MTKSKATNLDGCTEDHEHEWAEIDGEVMCCTPKSIPARLLVKASDIAGQINPVNLPMSATFARSSDSFAIMEPQRIAVLTSKYWGPRPRQLTVSFMESTPQDLRARILTHLNAWTKTGCISFVQTNGVGDIRISRGRGGYYSYLGTDVLLIPKNRQTMNLEGFTMNTPESEFKRVIRHEAGHTLGFPHEHMRRDLVARIDPQKAYQYFLQTQGWDKATVDAQVLTSLNEQTLMSTPSDQTSIMCYQLPGHITFDGKPIRGGVDINTTDYAFNGRIYPQASAGLEAISDSSASALSDEWDESEDVEVDMHRFTCS